MMVRLRNQDRLAKPNVIQRYGFLFLGYDPVRTPWWWAAHPDFASVCFDSFTAHCTSLFSASPRFSTFTGRRLS